MKVLLVDPSLFTAPYDAALSAGLRANGVDARWAVRGIRAQEEAELSADEVVLDFYRMTDGRRRREGRAWKLVKGFEHAVDLRRLERYVAKADIDLVHFQWTPLPTLDAAAMRRIRRKRPVALTVHDTTPFNGADVSAVQLRGFDRMFDAADHLIVHTQGAKQRLLDRGVAAERVSVIAHGPLNLRCGPSPAVLAESRDRWRIVLFGRMQAYKGLDVLIEAIGLLTMEQRSRIEVVIAGSALMPLEPLQARARVLGIDEATLCWRTGWLSEQDTADLLAGADALVFPYHAIEASGVLFLAAGFGKWLIASALGAFVDAIGGSEGQGVLLPPGDPVALAAAMIDSVGRVPLPSGQGWAPDWKVIGANTAARYATLLSARKPI